MNRLISTLILFCAAAFSLGAQDVSQSTCDSLSAGKICAVDSASVADDVRPAATIKHRHEWKIGWGDMMFESAVWRKSVTNVDYKYTGHIFAEYQYTFLPWLSAGCTVDYENVSWSQAVKDGVTLPEPEKGHYFNNICIMPSVRFTYFNKGMVSMYSGLQYGLLINSGSDTDYLGRYTACAPVLGLTLYAVSVEYKGFFGTFELGGLHSIINKQEIYMVGSRLLSISIGYRL